MYRFFSNFCQNFDNDFQTEIQYFSVTNSSASFQFFETQNMQASSSFFHKVFFLDKSLILVWNFIMQVLKHIS